MGEVGCGVGMGMPGGGREGELGGDLRVKHEWGGGKGGGRVVDGAEVDVGIGREEVGAEVVGGGGGRWYEGRGRRKEGGRRGRKGGEGRGGGSGLRVRRGGMRKEWR